MSHDVKTITVWDVFNVSCLPKIKDKYVDTNPELLSCYLTLTPLDPKTRFNRSFINTGEPFQSIRPRRNENKGVSDDLLGFIVNLTDVIIKSTGTIRFYLLVLMCISTRRREWCKNLEGDKISTIRLSLYRLHLLNWSPRYHLPWFCVQRKGRTRVNRLCIQQLINWRKISSDKNFRKVGCRPS